MTPDDQAGEASVPVSKKQARYVPKPETAWKARVVSFCVAWFIRLYSLTLRIRIDDRAGIYTLDGPVIWAFWHNRLLLLPVIYRRWARHRKLCVLTSPSRDGAVLAGIVKRFGIGSVRGSSNKRAAQSLVECRRRLLAGWDLGVTPDGPRGPVYVAAPGVIQLARLTGRPLMPVQVEYSRKWRLKSWDRFQIPRPFSRVTLISLPPVTLAEGSMEEASAKLAELLGGQLEE
jgi:lysophospholipid acyltransferase (LPLAT)-like uncharacterized protein